MPRTSAPRRQAALRLAVASLSMLAIGNTASAAMFKCQAPDGRTEYQDRPCKGDPKAVEWKPKQPLNVVSSESLTGRPKEASEKDTRPAWLRGPDPVGDCKRKGGTIDKELRACRLPD